MSNKVIMETDNLHDILNRMKNCSSLIYMLCEVVEYSSIPESALSGIGDLLNSICKDFDGNIGCAEDYVEKAVQA